jgi:hypothetical protein
MHGLPNCLADRYETERGFLSLTMCTFKRKTTDQSAYAPVRQVMAHYGDEKLFFVLHPFPLTMHRQAWDAAQVRPSQNQYDRRET